jgi:hypothetical protein
MAMAKNATPATSITASTMRFLLGIERRRIAAATHD